MQINVPNRVELGVEKDQSDMYDLLDASEIYISDETRDRVGKCRIYLDDKMSENKPIYGISTGFGSLANKWIDTSKLDQLQLNLIRSHAAGLGEIVPKYITKTAILLLINSLAKGYSGIRLKTLDMLITLVNQDIIPVTYEIGSLGASGDLATLAHSALVLIGEGKVHYKGKILNSKEVFEKERITPIILKAKEGLALINGTHFITSYTLHISDKLKKLIDHNIIGTSLSLEATRGTATAYDDLLATVRKHPGHKSTADKLREILKGSEILLSHRDTSSDHKVQDPYVFRCVPQILGAVNDAHSYLMDTLVREINSITDNPLIFFEEDRIISGGNFHAEPLAIPLETIGMALVEIGNVTEKRINRLVHPQTKELPAYLASDPGVESGYMITHYTVAALLNRIRVLSHPAVTDNISVSGSQEDHVSFGMGSALKTWEILEIVEQIVALEIYLAIRGLNMQVERQNSSPILENIINYVNNKIEFVKQDHVVHDKMIAAIDILRSNELLNYLK